MKRMWINQPSSLQRHHKFHGACVLAEEPRVREDPVAWYCRVWFTSGVIISMEIEMIALSQGWPPKPISDDNYCVVEIKEKVPRFGVVWSAINHVSEDESWRMYEKIRDRNTEHILPSVPFSVRLRSIHSTLMAEANNV